ncbi:STAS domain-containing protein [Reichenbachiella carrageenanivorans]|uniref:Anti-sigma factor antagonist n=1 Tax=Reichenbachiella carrageenanivorans TaxID=2979869 RepID=A0ABY6D2X0_9BACT|nr:STAS domain-containing protein [Reichenbachiella carrageenanivorans]UXX80468.1 STAS domain-containing protein [Reichenbachiella carrageenanivorans]
MIKIDNHINDNPEYYQLSVGGEVDASSSIHLEEGLKNAMTSSKKIIVDLAELEYISSAGLGVFMSIIQELENQKIKFVIYGMAPKVKEVFEILGLNQLINIKDTKEEALAAIQ